MTEIGSSLVQSFITLVMVDLGWNVRRLPSTAVDDTGSAATAAVDGSKYLTDVRVLLQMRERGIKGR